MKCVILAGGKGTLGKLATDDTLFANARDAARIVPSPPSTITRSAFRSVLSRCATMNVVRPVIADCIAVCSEIALDQEPPNEPGEKVETPEQLEDWRANEHKKMQKIMWGKLEKREKAIRAEGVKVQRGIYMGQPPEVLLRAK